MKKGKVLGKGQIALALMVLCLGAAIWLNMKFSSSPKYLGEATFVSSKQEGGESIATSANAQAEDYFAEAKSKREKDLKEAQEMVEETLSSAKLEDEEKQAAMAQINALVKKTEQEQNIEMLLVAKGFSKSLAIIGDDNINIVVAAEGLTTTQTMQIQDIVTTQTDISLSNIKIVTVK